MNQRLQHAFENEPVPRDLEARLRARLARSAPGSGRAGWRTALAGAAVLAVVAGLWQYTTHKRLEELLRVGLSDHVHCGIAGGYPHMKQRLEMTAGLGPEFAPMLQPVIDRAAAGRATPDTVESAHRCTVNGRAYVHIILKRGDTLISVIVTRRTADEAFPRGLAARLIRASGVELHQENLEGYEVAGFESGRWLGYVVSGLPAAENEALAARMAPVVRQFAL
jgi:hypothetical protein